MTDEPRATGTQGDHEAAAEDARVQRRAELNPEEREAGSDDPVTQARVILEDSEERATDRSASPGTYVEHRTSDETVEPLPDPNPDA